MIDRRIEPALHFTSARVIDPFTGRDEVGDVAVTDGRIVSAPASNARVIDASGMILCPGLMDMHVHLREPGQTHKETIASGASAAIAGGFTYVACMPNTSPALDRPETIRFVLDRAREADLCTVAPVAAITIDRAGCDLTDFCALRDAGAVAFSDDGVGVEDDKVMLAAFEQAARLGVVLIQHCEYRAISAGGVMHKGEVSRRLGVPGLDPRSEEAMIERDLDLCRRTGGRYHVAHISTARAVELVRRAKRDGLPVTSEVCTHHLVLTDEACGTLDPNTKMHPPLRSQHDVNVCRQGLLDGTIDCIVTDHAPHAAEEKGRGLLTAPAGVIGLETALSLAAHALVETRLADWPDVIRWFTRAPAEVLGVTRRGIRPGENADLTLIDPRLRWRVQPERLHSLSRNSPFLGWELPAKAVCVIRGTNLLTPV